MCQKSNQKQQIAVEVWALIKSRTPKSAELVSSSDRLTRGCLPLDKQKTQAFSLAYKMCCVKVHLSFSAIHNLPIFEAKSPLTHRN